MEFIETLLNYHWPGNVRELENIIERFVVLGDHQLLMRQYFGSGFEVSNELSANFQDMEWTRPDISLKEKVEQFELKLIEEALQKYGSYRKAAEMLGINFSTMIKKYKRYKGAGGGGEKSHG